MLTDIFWHPYFNIYGELFVDDPDKSKAWLFCLGNISVLRFCQQGKFSSSK